MSTAEKFTSSLTWLDEKIGSVFNFLVEAINLKSFFVEARAVEGHA